MHNFANCFHYQKEELFFHTESHSRIFVGLSLKTIRMIFTEEWRESCSILPGDTWVVAAVVEMAEDEHKSYEAEVLAHLLVATQPGLERDLEDIRAHTPEGEEDTLRVQE